MIGIIDESGHPKKGEETAGVGRQYCGNTGKIDNCVTTAHPTASSFGGEFRTMLESELYLPRAWREDRERCRAASHGMRFDWITADEWYGQKPAPKPARRTTRYPTPVSVTPSKLGGFPTPCRHA